MRTTVLGLAALASVALIPPRSAAAHVSVSVGLPGFFVNAPVYAPPVVLVPRVYASYPVYGPRYRRQVRYERYYRQRDCDRRRYHRRHHRWHDDD